MKIFNQKKQVILSGHDLDIDTVYQVARGNKESVQVTIDDNSLLAMEASRRYVFEIVKAGKPVYGINTGFGALSDKHIPENDLSQLQLNLIRSHCTGIGRPFGRKVTRAIMLLRANCLCSGFSGVNPNIVKLLLAFLNNDIIPIVPQKGSVGASGDLAPLSHIALSLIGEGDVMFEGHKINSSVAIKKIGMSAAVLGPKDGLALINGTAVMTALGALAIKQAEKMATLADIAAGVTLDAVRGTDRAYYKKISDLKPHKGQLDVCYNMEKILHDSEILHSHEHCGKVQDPYSLRCVPQVHGACRQTLEHARAVITTELNAVTDNPLIFLDTKEVVSGGNFHGEALALAMDYLAMGMAELCNISERRIEKMMNPTFSDLPPFLTKSSGLNSGLMIAHVTAAALTSENKYLCHPASVDSIPTSTDKEDHVSMGVTAGRKLHDVIFNLKNTLAIELLCATQGIEFHRPKKSSDFIEGIISTIRETVPFITDDRNFSKDIEEIVKLINNDQLIPLSTNTTLGGLR